jgi:hypothetical protein
MEKTIWLSFDLGIRGEYPQFYTWLDSREAKECGDNLAVLKYSIESHEDLIEKLTTDLKAHIHFKPSDRVYVVYHDEDNQLNKGKFIIGSRKKAIWNGYAHVANGVTEDF